MLQRAYDLSSQLSRNVGLNNDLGYSLADAGIRIDEAEGMIRYALIHDPDSGAYLDSMGWVLYKKGRFEQAQGWLAKAVDSPDGADPVVHDHLGDVNWRLGLVDEAVGAWNRSIELAGDLSDGPERPDLAELLRRVGAKLEAHESGRPPETAPLAAPEPEAAPPG